MEIVTTRVLALVGVHAVLHHEAIAGSPLTPASCDSCWPDEASRVVGSQHGVGGLAFSVWVAESRGV